MSWLRRRRKQQTPAVSSPPTLPNPDAFTRIAIIQDSIRELYTKLSGVTVNSYTANFTPPLPAIRGQDPIIGVQYLARAIAHHLGMAGVQLIVSFNELGRTVKNEGPGGAVEHGHAGKVELGAGPEYFIEVSLRYRDDLRATAAILAHEAMHIFLHKRGIRFADRAKNEILTDTASVYLGTGWLMLNAYRVSTTCSGNIRTVSTQTLGYVSPEELGYILAKRVIAFGENIEAHLSDNHSARLAYNIGYQRALLDYQCAPFAACSTAARKQYEKEKKSAHDLTESISLGGPALPFVGGYRFEGHDPIKVVFSCPACHHLIRLPTGRTVTARCPVCRSTLTCRT